MNYIENKLIYVQLWLHECQCIRDGQGPRCPGVVYLIFWQSLGGSMGGRVNDGFYKIFLSYLVIEHRHNVREKQFSRGRGYSGLDPPWPPLVYSNVFNIKHCFCSVNWKYMDFSVKAKTGAAAVDSVNQWCARGGIARNTPPLWFWRGTPPPTILAIPPPLKILRRRRRRRRFRIFLRIASKIVY